MLTPKIMYSIYCIRKLSQQTIMCMWVHTCECVKCMKQCDLNEYNIYSHDDEQMMVICHIQCRWKSHPKLSRSQFLRLFLLPCSSYFCCVVLVLLLLWLPSALFIITLLWLTTLIDWVSLPWEWRRVKYTCVQVCFCLYVWIFNV